VPANNAIRRGTKEIVGTQKVCLGQGKGRIVCLGKKGIRKTGQQVKIRVQKDKLRKTKDRRGGKLRLASTLRGSGAMDTVQRKTVEEQAALTAKQKREEKGQEER